MIDLHSHLLPGIDDGSESVGQTLLVLREFAAVGVTDVVMTPHLRASEIVTRAEEMIERRDLTLEELRREAPPGVRLHAGFEILLDAPLSEYAAGDRRFSVGGSRYFLVEFPLSIGPVPAGAALAALHQLGVLPLVAHPERYYACAVRDFAAWVARGAALQVDATTLTRPTNRGATARRLVQEGLAGVLAADNHGDRRSLATGRRYLEERGAAEAARWLTVDNPRAILADRTPLPVPPANLNLKLGERVRTWLKRIEG